jgi:hypothetical protein
MRRFALSYYIAFGIIALCLFGSILRRLTYTLAEFFLWFALAALVLFAILAAWRAGDLNVG